MREKARMFARGALCALAVSLCVAPAVRADVTITIPDDLCSDTGGEVTVPLQLQNDQPVRAIFARIETQSTDVQLVANSTSCEGRAQGFSCEANAVAGTGRVNLVVLSTGGDSIPAGNDTIMSLTLRLGTCDSSGDSALALRDVAVADPSNQPIAATTVDGLAACFCQLGVSAAKEVVKCQPAVAGNAKTLVVKRLKILTGCGAALLGCAQKKPGDAACVEKAKAKCSKQLAKLSQTTGKFVAAVEKSCGKVDQTTLLSKRGLGFEQIADQCSGDFAGSVDSIDGIARCLAAQHTCRADELATSTIPRLKELASAAQLSLDSGNCVGALARAGGPSGASDADVKPMLACQNAITNAGNRYVSAALTRLGGCVAKVLRCLQLTPGDGGCMAKAKSGCTKQLDQILPALAAKLAKDTTKPCTTPFATLAADQGLGLADLQSVCQAVGVGTLGSLADYQTCLARQHECLVRDLLQFGTPRAGEALKLVGDKAPSFCP